MKVGNRFARTIAFALLFSVIFSVHGILASASPTPFSDLPSNPLYYPAIEVFQGQNIIIGDTMGGKPIGQLRPFDQLQRDEFTKVAVIIRLLESGNTQLLNQELDPFTLKLNTLLQPYYKVTASNKAVPFSDIPEKDEHCAANPSGCTPWYTEFVNFASSIGMIKGYTEDNTFRPTNSILRIHALKLTIASNGNLPADQDPRVIRITNDPRLEGRKVRCLVGTEQYILANNGGNTQDAFNLVAYAMQADRLDIFGNKCQAFDQAGARTPKQRADYLQQPLRRQEIARYFALTTTIAQLQLDPATDPTVDTRSEYIAPIDIEIREEDDPLAKLKNPVEPDENPSLTDERYVDEPIYLNRPTSEMTIAEQTALSKTGRCCKSKDLYPESNCKTITYSAYSISEESDYNWLTYSGPPWHLATNSWDACWVPYPDILKGYTPPPPTSDYEILRRMMQRRNEIFGNLDAYYIAGHNLEETKAYGLGGSPKPASEISDINDWYKTRQSREGEINNNLDAYYAAGHNLQQTVEYGYTSDKLPIESYWVIKWYERKKAELEAIAARQRALQIANARAVAYRNQQIANANAAAAQKQELPWYLAPLKPFMPAIAPIYNAFVVPTVNKIVDVGIDIIISKINEEINASTLGGSCSMYDSPGQFGNPKYNFPTYLSTAPPKYTISTAPEENILINNPVTHYVLTTSSWVNETVVKPVGAFTNEYITEPYEAMFDYPKYVGGEVQKMASQSDQFIMGQFNKTPDFLKPVIQPIRTNYNLGKGFVAQGAVAVEGIFHIAEKPVETISSLGTLAWSGLKVQTTGTCDETCLALGKGITKGVENFATESFSSQDKLEENMGRLTFEIGTFFVGVGEAKTAIKTAEVTRLVSTGEKAVETVRALEGVKDLMTLARGLEEVRDVSKISKVLMNFPDVEKPAAILTRMQPAKASEVILGMSKTKVDDILNIVDDISVAKIIVESSDSKKIADILSRLSEERIYNIISKLDSNQYARVVVEMDEKLVTSVLKVPKIAEVKNIFGNLSGVSGEGFVFLKKYGGFSDDILAEAMSEMSEHQIKGFLERVKLMEEAGLRGAQIEVSQQLNILRRGNNLEKYINAYKNGRRYNLVILDNISPADKVGRMGVTYINGKFKDVRNYSLKGGYDFVYKDGEIYIGKGHVKVAQPDPNLRDITETVDFAGQLHFNDKGEMNWWSNGSGHFKPTVTGINDNVVKEFINAFNTKYNGIDLSSIEFKVEKNW